MNRKVIQQAGSNYEGYSPRFSTWCSGLTNDVAGLPNHSFNILPPVDVLMVWHSYMLNPGYDLTNGLISSQLTVSELTSWYSEDCIRVPQLRLLPHIVSHFTSALVSDYYMRRA